MKRFHSLLILFAALLPLSVTAQTSTDLNEGSILTHDAVNDIYVFAWWGKTGRTYFIQQSVNLTEWNYLPEIESGLAAVIQYDFSTNQDKIFARLQYTDQFTTHPETDDFDGDGISNIDEINMTPVQGDPLDASSNDGDSLPDDWEIYFFGTLDRDGSGDWNGDGLLDRDAFLFGLNPKGADESLDTSNIDLFGYDSRGWLTTVTITGSIPASYTLDEEGNLELYQ